jgi:hypothetical protein
LKNNNVDNPVKNAIQLGTQLGNSVRKAKNLVCFDRKEKSLMEKNRIEPVIESIKDCGIENEN